MMSGSDHRDAATQILTAVYKHHESLGNRHDSILSNTDGMYTDALLAALVHALLAHA
jgi:hypothetical protein